MSKPPDTILLKRTGALRILTDRDQDKSEGEKLFEIYCGEMFGPVNEWPEEWHYFDDYSQRTWEMIAAKFEDWINEQNQGGE